MRMFVIILIIFIAGCATKPIPVIYQCPALILPPEPKAYTLTLTAGSSPDRVVKSYAADLSAYKSWCHSVQKQINSK